MEGKLKKIYRMARLLNFLKGRKDLIKVVEAAKSPSEAKRNAGDKSKVRCSDNQKKACRLLRKLKDIDPDEYQAWLKRLV